MTTYTEDQIIKIGGKLWTAGTKRRVYLNDAADLMGIAISRYNTGNIQGVYDTIDTDTDRDPISNARGGELDATKVYWENGTIYIQRAGRMNNNQYFDYLFDRILPEIDRRIAALTD